MGRRTPGRETLRENILFYSLLRENVVFDLQRTFFDCFNVLLSFLAEKLIPNDHEITSKSKFWNQKVQL